MKKILIVNFTLPPYPGIGARRWAKFAKYLFRAGHDIKLFTAIRIQGEPSPWLKDIREFADRIEYVKPPFPAILGTIPSNLFQKLRYKLALEYVKRKYKKANYFDPSSDFGNKLIPRLQRCINEGYTNLIVSCGPFHMAHELVALKKKNPEIKLILDFRDPWANNKTSFGFLTISSDQLAAEVAMEKQTLAAADHVVSVSPEMTEYFAKVFPGEAGKYSTLENGFDREDFDNHPNGQLRKAQKMRFVFTGTLYEKSREVFTEFISALQKIAQRSPDIYHCLQFDFYGKVPVWFRAEASSAADVVLFHGEVTLNEVYNQISASHAGMLFLTGDLTYSRSTKFYEYLAMGKPIAVFSAGGATGSFVAQQGLGFAVNAGEMETTLREAFGRWKSGEALKQGNMDISPWDVANSFQKWIPLLN